jgi:hypothetical protein
MYYTYIREKTLFLTKQFDKASIEINLKHDGKCVLKNRTREEVISLCTLNLEIYKLGEPYYDKLKKLSLLLWV